MIGLIGLITFDPSCVSLGTPSPRLSVWSCGWSIVGFLVAR